MNNHAVSDDRLADMLGVYRAPGQALWRAFELEKVLELKETHGYERPILEIGCSDGMFASLVFDKVDDGIDIVQESLDRCRRELPDLYDRLHCMDARDMSFAPGTYRTVFANCVIEHIPGLVDLVASSYKVLAPGGKFVTTVPLREMNDHLLFRSSRYAEWRRKQLEHENLLTQAEWVELFKKAGFKRVELSPYLYEEHCRLWDTLDMPMCWGRGRYKVGTAIHVMGRILPAPLRALFGKPTAYALRKLVSARRQGGAPCAAALIAYK